MNGCRVLPTNVDDGMIECIMPSTALARVLADHRSIHRYLAQFHPDPSGDSNCGLHLYCSCNIAVHIALSWVL